MEVRIEDEVLIYLAEFYEFNLQKHPTLDEVTVFNKEHRLIEALKRLGTHANGHPDATRHLPWIRKGYKDYPFEGFHFGYKIETLPSGERVVVVYEARYDSTFF